MFNMSMQDERFELLYKVAIQISGLLSLILKSMLWRVRRL